jgi:23S rRNA-/tRNA-specific pseudouridylate synthase
MNNMQRWSQLCLPKNVKILQTFYDDRIIALEKPIGYLSHPNFSSSTSKQVPVVLNGLFNSQSECFTVLDKDIQPVVKYENYLLHRLDKGTSGILLISRDKETANEIKSYFKQRYVEKDYHALVYGNSRNLFSSRFKGTRGRNSPDASFLWEDPYQQSNSASGGKKVDVSILSSASSSQTSSIAKTKVSIVKENKKSNTMLLRLNPITGFTHQLRYQCALHGCPILGDDLYGNFSLNKDLQIKRLFLHSSKLSINHEKGKYNIQVNSKLPSEFTDFQDESHG